jgi:mannose-1-phosphate guanylyltransferase
MVALPADHWIGRRPLFESALKGAIAMAESRDDLVTIGVEPSRPDAGYGYILTGNRIAGVGSAKAYRVKGFIEKPTPRRASLLIRRQALWNSGIFAWRASVFLATLDRFSPTIRRPLARIERAAGGRSLARAKGRLDSAIRNEYRRMPDLSVDYAVLEAAAAEGRVLVIKGAFQWSDVGTWAAVYAILPRDRDGNAGRGKRLALDTRDCLVHSPGKLVALLGVHGIAIVDTSDAILIADLRRAQEVRDLARRLDRRSDLRRYR